MMLKVRNANYYDFKVIDELMKEYSFKLDIRHLKSAMVVEDSDSKIVGFGSLTTLLESTFVTDQLFNRVDRLEALKLLIERSDKETKDLGYENYHGYVKDELVQRLLVKHFEFNNVVGDNLIRWIPNGKERST